MNERRINCPMRHSDNGNCLPAGGFCTAVNDPICEALHNAFNSGENSKIEWATLALAKQNEAYARKNLEVLRQIHEKVTAPAIDPENLRLQGEWECEHETWGKMQCSICKKEALLEKANGDVGQILLYVTSNYCPNCGAKMKGVRNA